MGTRRRGKPFAVSRATLFRRRKALQEGRGKLASLEQAAHGSHAAAVLASSRPPAKPSSCASESRSGSRKTSLRSCLREERIATLSASTVGRMLADLKKQGVLSDPVRRSLSGRTGRLIERHGAPRRKKLRSKEHQGGLVKADTIVRFTNGIKRYVVTAIERESKCAFAYASTANSARSAADFLGTFQSVSPLPVRRVRTDNGAEFAHHFDLLLAREGIAHVHSRNRLPLAYRLSEFNRALRDWLPWYNTRRPHWSLGLVSPPRHSRNRVPRSAVSHVLDEYTRLTSSRPHASFDVRHIPSVLGASS